MNILRYILEKLTGIIALAFGLIAICLAIVPGFLAVFFDSIADDLSAEWRRGRRQNWLWRWAKHAKGVSG